MEVIFKDLDVAFDDALILHHVSGLAKPGEMLAVMGPSGAGKSTLLNAISGRLPIASGSILLNGNPMTHRLRRKICYVLQEDAFFPNLTLKQTLTYTALLRLPEKMPNKLKFQRVSDVIEQLDLKNCSDTAMGGMFMQGLSGGEKKRASIACELITNPALIMLDEPTSGLDSAIAYSLMKMMKQYTEKANKTVIATIHQPSSQIFHMFDNILLLAKGKVAYFGKCSKIIEFFSSLSLYCTPNWNPADFILEKVKESEEITNRIIKAADNRRYTSDWPPELRDSNASINNDISEVKAQAVLDQTPSNEDHPENVNIPEKDQDLATTQLIMKPSLSNGNANDVIVLCQNLPKMEETDEGYIMDNSYYNEGAKWQSTFLTQYVTLTQRSFFQAKTRILSKLNIIQTLVLGLVCGLLWFQTPKAEESLKDRNGMMFFVISYFGFFTMFDIITSFPEERTVITKERAAGIYRLSAYYLSKMTSEAPLVFLLPVIMTTMAYWMCGLTPAAGNYISFLLLVLLHSFVAQSFGIVVGVACLDLRTSITTGATFMLVTLLAGGFYQTHYPVWMEWAKYFSFLQYSYHAAMKIEYLHGTSIQCGTPGESVFDLCNQNKTAFITGDYYLTHSGITRPIYIDILVLVTLVFTFRILGYIILRYVRRPGGCKHK